MADKKISALTAATTPLAGTEVLPIVQSGATVKVAVSDLTAGRAISATQLTLTTGNVIVASGQGIDFSATPGTGTSELLNDYEEGTWTPALGGTWTVNPIGMSGTYVRINKTIYITLLFNDGTKSTSTSAYFTGLPYATTVTGTAAVTDSNITDQGTALFANTDRVWVTGLTFSGGTFLTGFYQTT